MQGPITAMSAFAVAVSWTMRPPKMTVMRSESSSSSSRSSLTSRTAAPAFRAATSRSWISATAAKSRPKTGLAAISTDTGSESSRASTARWTLPPESVAAGRWALPDERLDQLALAVARDTRDANDLAAVDRETEPVDGGTPGVVLDPEVADDEPRRGSVARSRRPPRVRLWDLARADHQL